ncbi:MAG: iron-containing alcohol dehydrogenase [Planctomycetota bacterium]|nr:MAG: iron-containing alcohol dehydrogenase [Planctomycetota bacterium]
MRYDLLIPRQVVFGWGRRKEIGQRAAALGRRAWVVSGSRTLVANGIMDQLRSQMQAHGVTSEFLGTISREPEVADVDQMIRLLESRGGVRTGDLVVAIGGGAGIDLGKALAALAPNAEGRSVQDYLEGVGTGQKLVNDPLPMVAIPTTAGTGSEATKNAVISSREQKFKKSLRDDRMIPAVALIDPELMVSCPVAVTAWSGMDAITQLIESLVTPRSTVITRALSMEGLRTAIPWIQTAVRQPDSRPAREALAHAAFLSGVTLANAGLGFAHGVAAALGVLCDVPHGLACAMLLPVALRVNQACCEPQLADLAGIFATRAWSTPAAAAQFTIESVTALGRELGVPAQLRELGVRREQLSALVPASRGNSMSGNPRVLSDTELLEILEECW